MTALGVVLVAVFALLTIAVYLFKIKGITPARGLGRGLGGRCVRPPLVLTAGWVWDVAGSCLGVWDTGVAPGSFKNQRFHFWQEKKGCFSDKKAGKGGSVRQALLCQQKWSNHSPGPAKPPGLGLPLKPTPPGDK